ncbi:MAG: hypothetical protein MJ201_03495 [Mycoplasmoidaceae bacterium]|nr:hypothetical protein [Mycoplasmoidaceae bacterium]
MIASSKKFALEHNFNFYAVGGHGSNNKAENLNSFLKNTKVAFDYLLITDSDEALHERFVEHAIKCFK